MTRDEIIKNAYNLINADLSGMDLSGANLSKAYLRGANLTGANLRGANLRGANIVDAKLELVNFSGAYLDRADFFGADLKHANFSGCDLRLASLRSANLFDVNLNGANLRGAFLPSPTMVLLAHWGMLPPALCAQAMMFDAQCHSSIQCFEDWANDGYCPYDKVNFQRAVNFLERRSYWDSETPKLTAYQLMVNLIRNKCADSDYHIHHLDS